MPKTKKSYDHLFKQGAVDLLLSSARPLNHVAAELGVSAKSLREWRDRALHPKRGATPTPGAAPVLDPAAEIRRLQQEVEYLRRQREILKKAMSILAADPQSGMP